MKKFIFLIALILSGCISCQKVDSVKLKKYTNVTIGYEISYPDNWFIKTDHQPEKGDTLILENISFDNIKEEVIVAGGGPLTQNGTSFKIEIWNSRLGGKNAKDIEESIRQGHFSSNQITQRNIVDKRLKQVRDTLIGGQNLKIWFGEGWADCGMDFIYKEKQFRFHFMSGTKEQFLKDHYLYDKMINSFKLLN